MLRIIGEVIAIVVTVALCLWACDLQIRQADAKRRENQEDGNEQPN